MGVLLLRPLRRISIEPGERVRSGGASASLSHNHPAVGQRKSSAVALIDICTKIRTSAFVETISISETRANLKAVVDRVVADKAPIAITRQKGEGVVMISQSEWESIEETLYLLSSPANAKHLMDGIAELNAGLGEEHELIEP